jgi:hypothetical protein
MAGRAYFVDTTKAVLAPRWGKESRSFSASFALVATIISYFFEKIKKNSEIRKHKWIEICQTSCNFGVEMVK